MAPARSGTSSGSTRGLLALAEFLLIGGWAMAVHGRPRATEDLDVLVRAHPVNSAKLPEALDAFGAPVGPHGVDAGTFGSEGPAYRFGMKPLRIELLTKISGVSFDEAIREPVHAEVDGRVVPVIGRRALLQNERAARRQKYCSSPLDPLNGQLSCRGQLPSRGGDPHAVLHTKLTQTPSLEAL